ncbi:dehydration-responsive element-binding protein 1E-like [Arachis stenosperma]|uniref:dehydration-responsive element-binding protein 1E-like n=1 Tax=Arachis stenosperma TaxID=217475 RepID=UPI0025AD6576|nr:dehydration-responsive element-binding protein 1E-like [Arachis stenosperma]
MNKLRQSSFDEYISTCSSSEASSSNNNKSSPPNASIDYDEAITLASSRPKKRAGRRIFKETRHPVYRGVRRRNNNRWVCELRVPNTKSKRIWLGTYATPEMAARAHDVAALALRGKSACLNFADSAWRLLPLLPAPTDDAEEIRRMAAEAVKTVTVEDGYSNNRRPVSTGSAVTEYEVCSGESGVEEDVKKDLIVDTNNDDYYMHDWVRSMTEEPLRSPPPFFRYDFGSSSSHREWNDMEVDAEVSLWSFSI